MPAARQVADKNPDKRPLNATAVAAELDAVQMDLDANTAGTISRTVTITAEGFHRNQRRRVRHRRILAGAALAGCMTLLVAAAAVLLPESQRETKGKYIAIVAPAESASGSREARLLVSNVLSAIKQGLSNREGLFLVPYSESERLRGQPLQEQARALNAQLLLQPTISCERVHCEASLELIDTANFSVAASRNTTLEIQESLGSRARTLQQLNYLLPGHPTQESEARFNISTDDYQRYLELYERRHDETSLEQSVSALEALLEKILASRPITNCSASW
ncbi:hypothetical protein [Microbulbifer taiwanensis]|uniref:hypothetical protein n=1 Tax=Microbulbifer taiwanensis TaxID=986746 RepID=UPI00361797CF